MSDWRQEAADRLKEKTSKGRFKLVEGDNTIRILPRVKSKKTTPYLEYLVHRDVGPNKRFLRCGHAIHGEGECWLCDKAAKLAKSDSKTKQKIAAALQPKEQFVVQIAVVQPDSGKMRGPYLWTVSTGGKKSLAMRLLGVLKNPKKDCIDPKRGYNLNIERTGTQLDTTYTTPIVDEEPSKVPSKILDRCKGFNELIPPYSEEQQKAAYFGQDSRDGEDEAMATKKKRREEEDEEDETPKKKKKHGRDEEDEDESEDEEEEEEDDTESEDEEDEDESPKKKKKKKSGDEEDEDEEEESEDEEDEDESPKKKKKKKGAEEEDEEEDEEEEDESEEDDTEEEDEDETPKKKKKKPADEDEEEEDEEEEPEEEDEEETPKKKKKKKSSEEDEEEEEEPEEEDEEEEERPKKKKKK